MRVGIDINEANVLNRVGSNQYAFEILQALYREFDNVEYVLYGSSPLVADMPEERAGWRYKIFGPSVLWTQWRLPLELYKDRNDIDLFFTPGHYAPRWCSVPSVVTIMDLAFLSMGEYFKPKDLMQLKSWTRYSVKNAQKIIAISESTKQDIIKQYQRDSKDIIVAYPGYSVPQKTEVVDPSKTWRNAKKYILFVGTIQPRKNIVRLIKAFEKLDQDIDLVLAGREGWLSDEIYQTINQSKKKHTIKLLGFVGTSELPSLYRNSLCVVMPGLYEGFGLPALEAIFNDAVPVVANAGSLPEVVGPDGLLFDPYSVESIMKSLQAAIQLTSQEKTELLASAKVHAKQFSWDIAAKNIRKVFDEITIS